MILVTGATGHLGGAVVDALLEKIKADKIAVLVRNMGKADALKTKGVELRPGDYDNYSSLLKAFSGIDKLYFVSASDIEKRDIQHINVVNAAKEAGIKHVVYTSFQRKNEEDSSPIAMVAKVHLETEKRLQDSGLIYTVMKHTLYADMLPIYMSDKVLETGTIFLPAGEGKAAYATRKDMAEAGAVVLTTSGHENKFYEISGTSSCSFSDIATFLSNISGKRINYVSPAQNVYREEMAKAGVPAAYIRLIASFSEGIKQGEFDIPDKTLEKLLGKAPTSVEEFLRSVYG